MQLAFRHPRIAGLLALALLLTACGGEAGEGLSCYPAAAQRWIYVKPDQKRAPTQSAAVSATVYVDRSGSMTGYVAGKTNFERPFQDLIESIPGALNQIGVKTSFRGFGRSISDPIAKPDVLTTTQYYQCASRNLATCENQESHLDAVFGRVRSNPTEMAVIITDLWLSNSDIKSSGWTALQPVLADILQGGRTVTLYGIDAPFDGRISDLPDVSESASAIPFRGRHPLYMLVIGSKGQVLALDDQLKNSGSKLIATGMRNGTIHRSVFTVDPGPLIFAVKRPLTAGGDSRIRQTVFEASTGVNIQQFELSPGLPRPTDKRPEAPSWTAPNDSSFITDAVWEGPVEPILRVWMRRDTKCTPASWLELSPGKDGIEPVDSGQRQRVSLSPERLSAKMSQRGGVYLVSGELRRTSVTSPNPTNRWMIDWNLAPERATATAANPPRLFPTLNLDEVARLMENSLATAAKRSHENGQNDVVAGFSALVKVKD
ncbi:hypothetical protein [Sphingomonas sp. LT1P40]|uniref:hypothetical protein n=1 Tax=Alteristakelama amylovorans TaxID=3096166 RepID=UPI002FC588E2